MSKSIYTQEQFDKILEERNELANENYKLKQHLAEKDEEEQEIYEMYNQERKKNWLYNRKSQDKISFCIEQLEKLRKHYCRLMWDGRSASDSWVIQECVDLLDKELKQLTHQHEDKGE